jgi:hypothetical protein
MILAISVSCFLAAAQQSATTQSSAPVPRLVNFTGKAADAQGKPIAGIAGVTLAIYKDQYEGAPLWLETQNVQADAKGNYTVQLGATKPAGLPLDLFSSGDARWLGVRVNGGEEQPRVVLVSVPYALKALDAETLGGRPVSAFMVAPSSGSTGTRGSQQGSLAEQANEIICLSGTACKTGFVPLFSSNGGSAKVSNSIITQSGTTVGISGNESVGGSLNAGSIVTGPISAGAINATGPVGGYVGGSLNSGVYGQAIDISVTRQNVNGFQPVGVWGDSGALAGFGVLGTEDNGFAVVGQNNSGHPTAYFQNNSGGAGDLLFDAISSVFLGFCTIDVRGNLFCTGSKSAVVPVDGASRKVALYAIEGPENWFEDAASGQLSNGEAVVNLESVFQQTVNTGINYQVFLTPNGDCKGLYVTQKTATSFLVRELGGGTSSIAFDYRILAKRKGYENIRLADKTEAFSVKNLLVRHPGGASHKMPNPQDIQKQMLERATARPVAQVSKAR